MANTRQLNDLVLILRDINRAAPSLIYGPEKWLRNKDERRFQQSSKVQTKLISSTKLGQKVQNIKLPYLWISNQINKRKKKKSHPIITCREKNNLTLTLMLKQNWSHVKNYFRMFVVMIVQHWRQKCISWNIESGVLLIIMLDDKWKCLYSIKSAIISLNFTRRKTAEAGWRNKKA